MQFFKKKTSKKQLSKNVCKKSWFFQRTAFSQKMSVLYENKKLLLAFKARKKLSKKFGESKSNCFLNRAFPRFRRKKTYKMPSSKGFVEINTWYVDVASTCVCNGFSFPEMFAIYKLLRMNSTSSHGEMQRNRCLSWIRCFS